LPLSLTSGKHGNKIVLRILEDDLKKHLHQHYAYQKLVCEVCAYHQMYSQFYERMICPKTILQFVFSKNKLQSQNKKI